MRQVQQNQHDLLSSSSLAATLPIAVKILAMHQSHTRISKPAIAVKCIIERDFYVNGGRGRPTVENGASEYLQNIAQLLNRLRIVSDIGV
jgi:hypothetical protein